MTTIKIKNAILSLNKRLVPTTAEQFVQLYSELATDVSSSEKTALTTFVQTLITANLWSKVQNFYPFLGSLESTKYDLKDVYNQVSNAIVTSGTTFSNNSLLYSSAPGQSGTPLSKTFDWSNGAVFIGGKPLSGTAICLEKIYTSEASNPWKTANKDNGLAIYPVCSGNNVPSVCCARGYANTWTTTDGDFDIKTSGGIDGFSFGTNCSAYAKKYGTSNKYYGTTEFSGAAKATDHLEVIFGNSAVGTNTYGSAYQVHFFMICNSSLTESEMATIANALDTLQSSLGRYTA